VVKIRLKRMGTTKRPVYRLVVADSRSPRDGRFIEAIGFYDPLPDPAVVRVDAEKVRAWMRRGARPSDSARQLLVQQGILQSAPRQRGPDRAAATAGAGDAPAGPLPEEAVEANPAPVIEEAAEESASEAAGESDESDGTGAATEEGTA
jgi:small subunit ribosomal protein S16